jgi:hypothetical protein
MMLLDDYLANIPNLHTWDNKTWNTGGFDRWAFDPLHALIAKHLPPHPAFIETRAGNSTLFFLLHAPSRVVSIAPDPELFERIHTYCAQHGISEAPLTAHNASSQWVLPPLAASGEAPFDFALIDGHHGMSMVFVDFHYLNALVRTGGFIMIDDVHLHSAAELANLLSEQWGYEAVLDPGKFVVFRKTTDARELPDFGGQPYVMRRSGLAMS